MHDEFSDTQRNSIRLINNRLYRLRTMRVNYTTYDIRRDYDTINPRTHPFIMCKSPDTTPGAHPYWYASVIGIFAADVQHVGAESRNPRPQRTEFLWVRWLGIEEGHRYGRKYGQLPRLGFIPDTDEDAFGFLDPSLVLRGSHLIPAFIHGRTDTLLCTTKPSEGRPDGSCDDWASFYVGMYVIN
jgi:hypothetical protein